MKSYPVIPFWIYNRLGATERRAVLTCLAHGREFGYGNLIAHLQRAWAISLIEKYGMDEQTALAHAGSTTPYPLEASR